MAGFLPRLFANALPRPKPFAEMGVSGTPVYAGYVVTAERNPRLIGQEKHRTFSDILANTSIVSAGIRYFLNVVARPSWSFEPADESDEAKKYAEFADHVLLNGTHTPWSRIIRRAGTYRFHGFQVSEWTAMRLKDDKLYPDKIGFRDIEARPQWTIWRWEVDERGTVIGCWQRDPLTGRELGLPRTKIMYLVDDTLTDSPEGMGLLRHCVEPADRLREYLSQEAVGFMRDLRGVPVGYAPMDELTAAVKAGAITQQQMDQAIDGLKDFVTLEKKGRKTSIIVNSTPYVSKTDSGVMIANSKKWDVQLMQGHSPGMDSVGKAIDRLNYELARIISCEHLLLGSTSSGSFALSKEKATDLYLMANSVLRDIRLQAQHDLVGPLWSLNGFPEEMKPKLKSEDVTPKDVEQIAQVMRDMATAGAVIPPDDEAINFVRDLLGAPQLDLKKYFSQMMGGQAGTESMIAQSKQVAANNKVDQAEDKQDKQDAKNVAKDSPLSIRTLRKVIGNKAADYIHDFVNSDNPKFRGKSKAERIRMALGAYYGKGQGADFFKVGPEDEPRDDHGRWSAEGKSGVEGTYKTDGSHVIAYHGTTTDRLPSIWKNGIKVSSAEEDERGKLTYVTHSKEEALRHAAERLGLNDDSKARPAAVELRIPRSEFAKFKVDSEQLGARTSNKDIPASWIMATHRGFVKSQSGTPDGHDDEDENIDPHATQGKSKAERIRMALGAYYAKTVPYAEAEPFREEDQAIAGQSGTPDGHMHVDATFDERANARPSGPSRRNVSTGRGDPLVPGSGLED